ncbi:uncharacterized protein LOC133480319 isoform X4 [Phyllopteryx taeniolatus]|uniref:uncharacterized protein LOC133480319 isoform X4 n=1 Tax=Phyllopteryx taeniolatus TaxID=161469 RepID=UPI002AD4F310|nr:uncharacterized protein LOC133480319 isoform X4 [Phyllopteryx taeniolatus]
MGSRKTWQQRTVMQEWHRKRLLPKRQGHQLTREMNRICQVKLNRRLQLPPLQKDHLWSISSTCTLSHVDSYAELLDCSGTIFLWNGGFRHASLTVTPDDLTKSLTKAVEGSATKCTGRRRGKKNAAGNVKEREIEEHLLHLLRQRANSAPALPPSEDELFFKSLVPSLQRLPTHQKEHVKFQIHKLIYDATTVTLNF